MMQEAKCTKCHKKRMCRVIPINKGKDDMYMCQKCEDKLYKEIEDTMTEIQRRVEIKWLEQKLSMTN